jgi:dienelactone hydrolase
MSLARRRLPTAISLVGALVLGACASSGSSASNTNSTSTAASSTTVTAPTSTVPATTTSAAPTNLAVTRLTKTFVDRSRATDDPDHTRSAPTRTLVTDIYIPAGSGPYPLIVHAHGAGGDARKFTKIAGAWARHGYVVAVPTFPLTSDTSGGKTIVGDYVNQPADLHFVLDQVLQLAATANTPLTAKIDTHHIGLSGLSLGGATAYGFGFNTCCHDPRLTAVIVMSGIKLPFGNDPYVFDKPILIFHGTSDPVIHYETAGPVYAALPSPKYFVTLNGAGHAPQYEDSPDPHDALVIATTLDFWNLYLKADDAAKARLLTDADHPPLSSIQSAP